MPERGSRYNQGVTTKRASSEEAPLVARRFSSMQAARISGVPFYTVDYWARSRFLLPTLARGEGRGRGRERFYSYHDVLRLRIARELRDEKVSLETLRRVVEKLGKHALELADARYVLVRRDVDLLQTPEALVALLSRPGKGTFGILLDLTDVARFVAERARKLRSADDKRIRGGF
jgi:DNA-binding transcriptional MerR regulator